MSRWENEDISDLSLPDPDITSYTFLDKNGKNTENQNLAVAKIASTNNKNVYYIKYGRGEIIDPHHVDTNIYTNDKYYTFKKVTDKAFAAYQKFLNTKNRLYFTTARRLVMENIK